MSSDEYCSYEYTYFITKKQKNCFKLVVQVTAWCRTGDKLSLEQMMTWLTEAYMHYSASMCWEWRLYTGKKNVY